MALIRRLTSNFARTPIEESMRAYFKYSMYLVGFLLLAFGFVATAHEPITTKVRFNKEVIRIFQRSCLACHRPEGIAPMSLGTYEEARPWAKAIKEEILEKRMPPWHAVKGYGDFRNAPQLTQHEVDLIVNWVEGGAPKGDEKDLPAALFPDDWVLGKPSLVLRMPDKAEVASDADEHRTFIIPTKLKRERWLTAVDLKPGRRSVVHCATVLLERNLDSRSTDKDGTSPADRSKQTSLLLGAWAPGQRIVPLPQGNAKLLPAGSRLILKIHYRGSGESTKDRSSVGLYFATNPPQKIVRQIVLDAGDILIPAGAESHRVVASTILEESGELISLQPRANPLIVSLQATAHRPDGVQEVLIWTRGFAFDGQTEYLVKKPVDLPRGTRIEVIAYLNNSENNKKNPHDPPKQLRWSDLTNDPLCIVSVSQNRQQTDRASR